MIILPNKTGRSYTYTQLDSRKQVIALCDRVTTVHKESSLSTEIRKINSPGTRTKRGLF